MGVALRNTSRQHRKQGWAEGGCGLSYSYNQVLGQSYQELGSWGAGMAHQSWFKSIPRGWVFLHPNQSATECRRPLESGQAAGFSLGLVQQRD